jgi:hypothetical protein
VCVCVCMYNSVNNNSISRSACITFSFTLSTVDLFSLHQFYILQFIYLHDATPSPSASRCRRRRRRRRHFRRVRVFLSSLLRLLRFQRERFQLCLEHLSCSLRRHQIPSRHLTFKMLQRHSARVFKLLSYAQNGLFANHPVPVDELFPAVLVGDFKPSRNQLHRFRHRFVFDSHVIRVHEPLLSRGTLLGN